MAKDLTVSNIDRQNILNNPYAVAEIQKSIGLKGIEFNGKVVLLKEQVAAFFEVTPRTIDNYLSKYEPELKENGYEVLRGNSLKEFKLTFEEQGDSETDFMREMENISYHLAAGKIDKEFLRDLIEAVINESYDENEELKLRLLNAIQEEL